MSHDLTIRAAREDEVNLVLDYIHRIARFEKLAHTVTATTESLSTALFGPRPKAEVCLAFVDGQSVGFALYYENFSTFVGQAGLFLEDLYVDDAYRGLGYGRALFLHVACIARARNSGRMEWSALQWNENAIAFYRALGARSLDEWTTFRLDRAGLDALPAG